MRRARPLLLAAALLSAGGSDDDLDEVSLAEVQKSRLPAFVLLLPHKCTAETCVTFAKFWQVAGEQLPAGATWKASCGRGGGAWDACEALLPSSRHRLPQVMVWAQAGEEGWTRYSGERTLPALADFMKQSLASAGGPPGPKKAQNAKKAESAARRRPTSVPWQPARWTESGWRRESGERMRCLRASFRHAHASLGASRTHVRVDAGGGVDAWDALPPLRPSELAPTPLFTQYRANTTVELEGTTLVEAEGHMAWPPPMGVTSRLRVLRGAVSPFEVRAILALVNVSEAEGGLPFDTEPDSVDGMASHEIFVTNDELREYQRSGAASTDYRPPSGLPASALKRDANRADLATRQPLRDALQDIMGPILRERITPYVRRRYRQQCGEAEGERACTPCYSLVRRYRPGERRSHALHYDGHALVTVVISLSSYGDEYTGGLYLASGKERYVLPLSRGDAAVHGSDLFHGVKVEKGERWSWILWYRDSATCQEHGHEWFAECAEEGNPICQGLHATKTSMVPGVSPSDAFEAAVAWNTKAAEGGNARCMLKLARAHLKQLSAASMPYAPEEAERWFRRGIRLWDDAECHYGLAQMRLANQTASAKEGGEALVDAVRDFEAAAARGHEWAAFNLGVAHLLGHGVPRADASLAAEWFEASGLPEGLRAVSYHHEAAGRQAEAARWAERAESLGDGSEWRDGARDWTGSGGAGGVQLHSWWPRGRAGC